VFTPLPLSAPLPAPAGAAGRDGLNDQPPQRVVMLIRGQATAPLVRTLRRELRDAAAGNVVTSAVTMDQIMAVMGQEMLAMIAPLTPLISVGVLLTAAGIYGVLAFAVARRGRELAVRVAMGAERRDLVRLVTRHTLRLVGAGLLLGLGLMFVLSRLLRASGGAGSPYDPMPIAFIVPATLIVILGIAAAWLPARRASAIDPVVLLRNS
jgi:putative ABC transport system permease protein